MFWILVAVAIVAVIYLVAVRPLNYWKDKGVSQGSPVPLFGHSWRTFIRKESFADFVVTTYNMDENARYTGMYQFMLPTLVLKDPDLIKAITVKDFDHFLDHRSFVPEEADPLWGKNLFSLTGQKWRDMRSTLSPAFTSSKMKFMFALMSQNAEQFTKYFLKQDQDSFTIEMKDLFTRYTNDVIASTAFGIECDSLEDRSNEFYKMGKEVTDFSGILKSMRFFAYIIAPKLCGLLKLRLFSEDVGRFFTNLVTQNMESREKHGIVRPDLIHLLMEARKNGFKEDGEDQKTEVDTGFATVNESADISGSKTEGKPQRNITPDDIVSQALIFFFAGFDSVSSLICFMSYELGVNPDVQQRLIEEIDEVNENCKGKLTYEALMGMKYMDMVISESLRKWPNAVAVDRICTKPYTIEPTQPGEQPIHLERNAVVWLPIFAIHRDPKNYPEPEKFDPERFSDENKVNIKPYTYLPFGSGPRNCIGSRFALLECKVLVFHILSHFEIVPNKKTQIPLQLTRKGFNMNAENGFWFDLKRRNKSST